ncbi:MAG: formate/nitrite transporter family protein [Roseburia inulinivorans]
MFQEEINGVAAAAAKKVSLLKNRPFAYLLLSMLAGIYVGLGILLIFTIGGLLSAAGFAGTKIVMGISFGIALSLVIMAGSELFTGNNFVMTVGMYQNKVTLADSIKLWCFCWLGNLVGSVLTAVLFVQSGLNSGAVAEFIASTALTKTTLPVSALLIRGLLCNVLVCLAVWCGLKMKSESGKLIMIFWCLFAFITTGFEHSVANMTLLAIGVMEPMGQTITIGSYFYNLLFVTLGNMIGGIVLIALPYAITAGKEPVKQ